MPKIHRRGATVVEFALTFPILLIVVFGGVELTRFAMLKHTANHAALSAARKAIVPGADAADVIVRAEEHLNTIGISGAVVSVNPLVITDGTNSIQVDVAFPTAENSLVVPEFVSGMITGQSVMMTERSRDQMSLNLPEPPAPPAPDPEPQGPGPVEEPTPVVPPCVLQPVLGAPPVDPASPPAEPKL